MGMIVNLSVALLCGQEVTQKTHTLSKLWTRIFALQLNYLQCTIASLVYNKSPFVSLQAMPINPLVMFAFCTQINGGIGAIIFNTLQFIPLFVQKGAPMCTKIPHVIILHFMYFLLLVCMQSALKRSTNVY